MGVGVDRGPSRTESQDLVQVLPEPLHRLAGKAVDQVHVHVLDSHRLGVPVQGQGLLPGLLPPDGRLHLGGEVLHPHAQAVEPQRGQGVHVPGGGHPGIDLDGHLGLGKEAEVGGEGLHELTHLVRGEMGRGAPAPVELEHAVARPQGAGHLGDFAVQPVQVAAHHVLAPGDHHVAAAEVAAVLAEGDVDVEGERIPGAGGGPGQPLRVVRGAEGLGELRSGGVAGVAGTGPVVAGQKLAGDLECVVAFAHWVSPVVAWSASVSRPARRRRPSSWTKRTSSATASTGTSGVMP